MKYFLTLCFAFFLFALSAQTGFIKAYDFEHPGLVFSDMLLHEDTLIVSGIIIDDQAPYPQGILFAKLDTLGQLLSLKKHFGTDDHTYGIAGFPSGLIKVADGSGYILLTGYFETGNGIVMKLDPNGDLLWQYEYPDNNSQQDFYKVVYEVEDGFLIAGHKYPTFDKCHLFVMKIDNDGNKQWEQSYWENDQIDNLQGLFREGDEFIISSYANFQIANELNYTTKIMAIDGYGNIEWEWESTPSLEEVRMIGLTHMDNGWWVYGSMKALYMGLGIPFQYQLKLILRNEFFSFVKEVIYDDIDGYYDDFISMIPLSDGDWLGLGANMELVEEPNLVDSHVYAWMSRISNGLEGQPDLGDTLWTREDLSFPDTAGALEQYLHSAVELPNGSIVAAGYFSYFFGAPMNHGLLIKVNQHGCLNTLNCIPTNLTSVHAPSNPAGELNVYPNPAHRIVYFEHDLIQQWDKVEVIHLTGEVLRSGNDNLSTSPAGNCVSLEELPAGVYLLRLWKEGRFWTRRVVRQ